MESYLLVKTIHVSTVSLSLCGFLLRSYWRFASPAKLQTRLVKVLPHVNDSLLLLSAILLTILLRQYPFTHDWLTAKFFLLLLYIVAGSMTLKTAYSDRHSLLAFLVAITSFGIIVLIALRHAI